MPVDDDWTEPDDAMGLWEHQGHPLTVDRLLMALRDIDPKATVEIERYDGMGTSHRLRIVHIDTRGQPPRTVVVTAVD